MKIIILIYLFVVLPMLFLALWTSIGLRKFRETPGFYTWVVRINPSNTTWDSFKALVLWPIYLKRFKKHKA